MTELTLAAGLGAVTGSRSLLGPALLARARGRRGAALALATLATAEIVGDKIAAIPARTTPLPFMARLLMGAVVGAAAARRHRLTGAILGSASAGLAAVLATRARGQSKRLGVPNLVAGLGEDILAISLGLAALRAR